MDHPAPRPDRLRELLDAVLDDDNLSLDDMADDAFSSPFHFSRQLSRAAGEAPVAMRRRVMLERAAWQLRTGLSVTEVAFAAGYQSVEGFSRAFSRAFGHPPSRIPPGVGHWLPAPNGIHFHSPTSLWVDSQGRARQRAGEVSMVLVMHDLDDSRVLLDIAKGLPDNLYRKAILPEAVAPAWEGPDASIVDVLGHLVQAKEVWLAALQGEDLPAAAGDDPVELLARHDAVAPRWLAALRDIDRRSAWGDRLIDALCEPPESFVLAGVLAHVLTYAAHRRQLARRLLRSVGVDVDDGDPINWQRRRSGGTE